MAARRPQPGRPLQAEATTQAVRDTADARVGTRREVTENRSGGLLLTGIIRRV